jgi:hypothetical protein
MALWLHGKVGGVGCCSREKEMDVISLRRESINFELCSAANDANANATAADQKVETNRQNYGGKTDELFVTIFFLSEEKKILSKKVIFLA